MSPDRAQNSAETFAAGIAGAVVVVAPQEVPCALTVQQWNFVQALSERIVKLKLPQHTGEGEPGKNGEVRLGLPSEVEWLPQRYTAAARRRTPTTTARSSRPWTSSCAPSGPTPPSTGTTRSPSSERGSLF